MVGPPSRAGLPRLAVGHLSRERHTALAAPQTQAKPTLPRGGENTALPSAHTAGGLCCTRMALVKENRPKAEAVLA